MSITLALDQEHHQDQDHHKVLAVVLVHRQGFRGNNLALVVIPRMILETMVTTRGKEPGEGNTSYAIQRNMALQNFHTLVSQILVGYPLGRNILT